MAKFSDEDFDAFVRPQTTTLRSSSYKRLDREQEQDEIEESTKPRSKNLLLVKKSKKAALEKYDIVDDADAAPVVKSAISGANVPISVWNACQLLLSEFSLSSRTQQELTQIVQRPSDMTQVDPLVIICDTIPTGSCDIYVKEVVPVSHLIIARGLKLEWSIDVVEDMASPSKTYDEVRVKPIKRANDDTSHIQPFGLVNQVRKHLGDDYEKMIMQVEYVLSKLGAMTPEEATSIDFMNAVQPEILKVIRGEKVYLKEKKNGLGK